MTWVIAALAATGTIALNPAAPALTPAEARARSPSALADALLAPGHPRVTETVVGPEFNGPPPPPGAPSTTEIRLYFAATRTGPLSFCEKKVALVTLAPVFGSLVSLPPARPRTLALSSTYRWRAPGRSCEGDYRSFFSVVPKLGSSSFGVVRALAELRRRRGAGVPVSIDDRYARDIGEYWREHPDKDNPPPVPITDGRKALAAFPIDAISGVYPAGYSPTDPLTPADLRTPSGRALEGVSLFAGGEWNAGLVLDGGRIVRVRLERAIQPPF